jgi:hypothetical protein
MILTQINKSKGTVIRKSMIMEAVIQLSKIISEEGKKMHCSIFHCAVPPVTLKEIKMYPIIKEGLDMT